LGGDPMGGYVKLSEYRQLERALADAELRAREAEKDAGRYRAKRDNDAAKFVSTLFGMGIPVTDRDRMLSAWLTSYDSAIDAALAQGGRG